jgi:hypothetical protein
VCARWQLKTRKQQHGVKRQARDDDAASKRRAVEAPKIQQYCELCAKLQRLVRTSVAPGQLSNTLQNSAGEFDGQHLPLSTEVLTLNPEMGTAWAYRRRVLLSMTRDLPCVLLLELPHPLSADAVRRTSRRC